MHLVVLLALLVGGMLFVSWYKRAPKAAREKARNRVLLFGGGALLILMVVRGGLHPLIAAGAAAIPLAGRLLGLLRTFQTLRTLGGAFQAARGPKPGKGSEIRTRFVRMRLDHDTGEMTGEIVDGRFRGRELGSLTVEELSQLRAECRADPQSAQVLAAYLEREHPDVEWGASDGEAAPAAATRGMGIAEAREILGVDEHATVEEIVAAHRRLMQRLHPDRGGSAYLATRINQAKDLLTEQHRGAA